MNKDYEWEYECENCGGTFIIKPDLEETIEYCPQCSDNKSFRSILSTIQYSNEEGLCYDVD